MIYFLYGIRDRFNVWRPLFSARDDQELKAIFKNVFKDGIPEDLKGSQVFSVACFNIVDPDEPVRLKDLTLVGLIEDFEVKEDA